MSDSRFTWIRQIIQRTFSLDDEVAESVVEHHEKEPILRFFEEGLQGAHLLFYQAQGHHEAQGTHEARSIFLSDGAMPERHGGQVFASKAYSIVY